MFSVAAEAALLAAWMTYDSTPRGPGSVHPLPTAAPRRSRSGRCRAGAAASRPVSPDVRSVDRAGAASAQGEAIDRGMRPDPFRMIVFHGSDLGGERAAFGVGDRTLNNILS